MFRFLHGIGVKRFKNLARNFKENGLSPRIHCNTWKVPHNALSFSSTQFFVKFVFNYAKQHALLLPGRVPGYSRSDLQLLPSSVSKRAIWRVYHVAAEANGFIHKRTHTHTQPRTLRRTHKGTHICTDTRTLADTHTCTQYRQWSTE